MTFDEIKRQTTYVRQVQFGICNISPPQDSEFGLCQVITAMDTDGNTECLNYFFDSEQLEIAAAETPEWYTVKWMAKEGDDGYFKCYPCEPVNDRKFALKEGKSLRDKRTLGMCRHGILCSLIQYEGLPTQNHLGIINNLAEFSISGEIKC